MDIATLKDEDSATGVCNLHRQMSSRATRRISKVHGYTEAHPPTAEACLCGLVMHSQQKHCMLRLQWLGCDKSSSALCRQHRGEQAVKGT